MHLYSNERAKVRGALLFWLGLQLAPSGNPTQNNRQSTRITMCCKTVRPYVTCCSAGLQLTLLQDLLQAGYHIVVPQAINIAAYVIGLMTVNTLAGAHPCRAIRISDMYLWRDAKQLRAMSLLCISLCTTALTPHVKLGHNVHLGCCAVTRWCTIAPKSILVPVHPSYTYVSVCRQQVPYASSMVPSGVASPAC